MMVDLENKILYVDMDGVLAKWENAPLKEVSTEGFFISREPVKTMLEAVCLVYERGVEVHILTAVPENSYAKDEKKEWLRIWLTWIPESNWHFIPFGSAKTVVQNIQYIDTR